MDKENDFQVSFDELKRLRILGAEDFKHTEQLAEEAHGFTTSE